MQSSIVEKLLQILSLVSETNKPLKFAELVSASGMNKSTMHRLLSLAQQNKLVQFDEGTKSYLLGSKIFDWARNAYQGYDIQIIALNEMMRLNQLVGENVTIGVPVGNETVYLRVLEARESLGSIAHPGMREPLHCSASGKALLAFRPDSIIELKLANYSFKKYTARTITSVRKFKSVLQEVRLAGYATNDREEYEHFVGISAPVFNYLSEPVAVLNIWAPHQRCPIEALSAWADELMASASRVTELIGGKPPVLEYLSDR